MLDVINGSEQLNSAIHSPAEHALVEFYKAFNEGDMALMQSNWANDTQAEMSNPVGGIKRGWSEIESVYDKIFNGPATVFVEYYDFSLHQGDDFFYAVGRERGFFEKAGERMQLRIRTSRFYRLLDGQWRQVHHHGSMDEPNLLRDYQTAVLGQIIDVG